MHAQDCDCEDYCSKCSAVFTLDVTWESKSRGRPEHMQDQPVHVTSADLVGLVSLFEGKRENEMIPSIPPSIPPKHCRNEIGKEGIYLLKRGESKKNVSFFFKFCFFISRIPIFCRRYFL